MSEDRGNGNQSSESGEQPCLLLSRVCPLDHCFQLHLLPFIIWADCFDHSCRSLRVSALFVCSISGLYHRTVFVRGHKGICDPSLNPPLFMISCHSHCLDTICPLVLTIINLQTFAVHTAPDSLSYWPPAVWIRFVHLVNLTQTPAFVVSPFAMVFSDDHT